MEMFSIMFSEMFSIMFSSTRAMIKPDKICINRIEKDAKCHQCHLNIEEGFQKSQECSLHV